MFALGTGFGANGIEASADGKWLIIVHSTRGELYRINPTTGQTIKIDLGTQSVSMENGLRFRGALLYVMRNRINELVVIDLSDDLAAGTVVHTMTQPTFDVPTTLALFGNALYTVNARFTTPVTPETNYTVARIPLK